MQRFCRPNLGQDLEAISVSSLQKPESLFAIRNSAKLKWDVNKRWAVTHDEWHMPQAFNTAESATFNCESRGSRSHEKGSCCSDEWGRGQADVFGKLVARL
jgi:hypothetical protein